MGRLDTVSVERRFQLLVDSVTDYAIYMLDPDGRIASWNSGAQRIKGYTAAEILGQHYSRCFTEADRAAGVPKTALDIARAEGRYEAEGWRVRKDGSLFFASVVLDAIHDDDGEVIGFAKVTRDVTERLRVRTELELAQRKLAQAQKMEALGQLTGGVAHDFNNLMMIVSGQTQALGRHVDSDPRAARALEAIDMAVSRAETLTRQLLTFSRRQRLNPQPIDIGQRIEAFREVLQSSLHGAVQMTVVTPPDLWPVAVDLGEFELALVNIAVNARDAMPDGGRFGIEARNVTLTKDDHGLELEGEFVALVFKDSGVGIPEDILPKVIEPFFTTKQVNKGTGLGLSQVYGLAHQSGGAISIESTLGEGSTITLYLPRTTRTPAQEPGESGPAAESGGHVLVVEDNPEVAAVSAALLEQLGYAVDVAGDAESAMRTLEREGPFDLVFSDIVMAGPLDGIGLARRIRKSRRDLPVLLTSGYSRAADTAQAEFPILRKPFQIGELGRMVGQMIGAARRRTAG
jgi:PAS domain S-box-containing protein